MKIQILLVSLMLCAVSTMVGAQDAPKDSGEPPFHFDCSGKADGNYPDPAKPDHYVACVAQTYAYEMPCALGHGGKRLYYVPDSGPDPAKSRCDYPEVVGIHDADDGK
ncbi:carbohydrate-binding module family 14 protein [Rhizobium sp.]|uniref:carbohydrate-binding module family 14 protein n=1 Tax=Rhizobium sp. TaxID=391 RepID=UPI002F14F344